MSAADGLFICAALASLGGALGAVGISFGELFYARAIADGKIENCEKEYIRATFWSLRAGMALVLIGSIGRIALQYFAWDAPQHALTDSFWMSLTLAIVVMVAGWALSSNRIPWRLGSALGFAGWWMIFVLTSWPEITEPYTVLAIAYAVAVALSALLFKTIQTLLQEAARKKML
jgi:hypothetical protein